ncbi:MAG TPA: hypothetical protein EYG92_11490 [Lutibacter sp.]|nr:hypothetical protein [Lutibacter sp.]
MGVDAGNKLAGNDDLWSEGKLKQDKNFGETGFSAVPAGYRYSVNGSSEYADYNAYWWTSKEDSPTFAYLRGLNHYRGSVNTDTFRKSNGFSVRCVKN